MLCLSRQVTITELLSSMSYSKLPHQKRRLFCLTGRFRLERIEMVPNARPCIHCQEIFGYFLPFGLRLRCIFLLIKRAMRQNDALDFRLARGLRNCVCLNAIRQLTYKYVDYFMMDYLRLSFHANSET